MVETKQSDTPKWILIGTGVLGLIAAGLLLVVRYYEIDKARAEAEQARITADRARVEAERPKSNEPARLPTPLPQLAPPPASKAEPEVARPRIPTPLPKLERTNPDVATSKPVAVPPVAVPPVAPAVETITMAGAAQQGNLTIPGTVEFTVQNQTLSGKSVFLDQGRQRQLAIVGTVQNGQVKAQVFNNGQHWSDWTGQFDATRTTFTGTFAPFSPQANPQPGTLSYTRK